jgi:hypothetical protein
MIWKYIMRRPLPKIVLQLAHLMQDYIPRSCFEDPILKFLEG